MSGWRAIRRLAVAIAPVTSWLTSSRSSRSGFAASFWLVPLTEGERPARIVARYGTRIVTTTVTIPGRQAAKVVMT